MPLSRLLALLVVLLSQYATAQQTVPLADFVVVSQSRGAKSVASFAGENRHKVRSFTPQSALWTFAHLVVPAGISPCALIPAGQVPPDVPVSQETKSVGPEKAQSYAGLSAVVDGVGLPEASFCLGKGVIINVLGPVVLVLDATTGLSASPPFNFSAAVNFSLISTECIYDPATSKFYLAATNGSHVFVAVSVDPTAKFVGPFVVQANGLNPQSPGQALPGHADCLADPGASCQASKLEVSVDGYGLWFTVQLVDTSACVKGSLLIGIPKDSLMPGSRYIPPYVTYSSWAIPDGSFATDLHLSHAQADGSHASAEKGTLFVLASYFANSSIFVWAVTNTASLKDLALGDDTSLPLVSEMNAVSTYPVAAPGSFTGLFFQDSHSALPPELGFTDLSHVTFDHNTGYLWTAAPTAITVNGEQARAGAAYFVIKPDIVNGEFEINLVTQGYTTYYGASAGAAFLSPVITVNASQFARLFGLAHSPATALAQAYTPVSLKLGPGAVVYTVTRQGADGGSIPIAARAGVDSDGTFWMMSGEAHKQDSGCSSATSCTLVRTTITRFLNQATAATPTASAAVATQGASRVPSSIAPQPAALAASGTAAAASAPTTELMEVAPTVARTVPAAASSDVLTWPIGNSGPAPPPATTPIVVLAPPPALTGQRVASNAKPLGADSPILFGVQLPKLPSFGATTPQLSPSPVGQLSPDAKDVQPTQVGPTPTPTPPPGLFQLPKLPMTGQQSPLQAGAVAQEVPKEEAKPDTGLGWSFPRLPSFGQQPESGGSTGTNGPWGFKLPFISFRAATAPKSADGLMELIGPAEAPDVALHQRAAAVLVAEAPSTAAVSEELAWQFEAPYQEAGPALDHYWRTAPLATVPGADLQSSAGAQTPGDSMGPTDAASQAPMSQLDEPWTAPSNVGVAVAPSVYTSSQPVDSETVRGAVESLYLANAGPSDNEVAMASPPQVSHTSSKPVDTETVRQAVETLYLAQGAGAGRGSVNSPLAAQAP